MGSLFGSSGGQQQQQQQTQSSNQTTRYSPEYENYVNSILQRATSAADKPLEQYDVNKMFAGFTPDQQQAFQQIRNYQGAYQGYFDQAKGGLDKAGQLDVKGSAQPYLDAAGNAVRPWEAGAGALSASGMGWTTPGVRDAYMGDYQEGAINRAADLSNRNFMEKTMPGITSQFAKGQGALGRGNYARFTGNAVRDLAGEQAGTAATMMDKGYWQAANTFGADQTRLQQAGVGLGNLANQNMGALSNLAKTNADITTGAVNTGIGLSNAYAQQAGALSNINLMNTNALLQAGNQQQQQEQLPLTALYQQFQERQKYPFEMVNFLNAAQRGLNFPTTQSGSQVSQAGSSSGSTSTPSTAGSVLGVLSAANSLGGKGNVGGLERGYNALFGGSGDSSATSPSTAMNQWYQGTLPGTGADWANTGGAGAARGGSLRAIQRRVPRFYRGGAVSRYAVGGDVPVARGMNLQNQPPMPPPGGMSPPSMGALPPSPFAASGGLSMPMMPPMPNGGVPPGALSGGR